jgi:stage II sporulation protein D
MRIDQRKKWYQKIKYNKNFKIVASITVILIFVVGYMIITNRNKMGEDTQETDDSIYDGMVAETIVIDEPNDMGDLEQYSAEDTEQGTEEVTEYDYTIQGIGHTSTEKKTSTGSTGSDRTAGGSGDGGSSVVISGMNNVIRVLLTNNGSYSQSHVEFTCTTDFTVSYDGEEETHKAKELITLASSDDVTKVIVTPDSSDGMVTVSSISKSGGAPSYHGYMEITKTSGGYVLINKVDIEDYLCGVVSSEVSSSYSKEALKAQAVCARGYAYRKLGSNYKGYSADLDDTTSCQVYNNHPETANSIEAVEETAGIVPTYNGEIINAVYFSTSCGTTVTSDKVWGGTALAYTCTRIQNTALESPSFSDEAAFRDFMDGKTDTDCVERDLPMYRWTVTYTENDMKNAVSKGLSRCSGNVYVKKGDSWVASSVTSVGDVESVAVTERDDSGLVEEVTIEGSDCTVKVSGQSNLRVLFATDGLAITEQNGSTLTGWTGVPSNFYYVKKDSSTGLYTLKGGGYGHGVGMSQNGANELAKLGYTCAQIISHYYNGAVLSSVSN